MIAGLPYDAEVEWIESVKPAYIDTCMRYLQAYTVALDAQFKNPSSNLDTGIGSQGDDRGTIRVWPSVNQIQLNWYGGYNSLTTDGTKLYERHLYEFGPSGIFFDGNQITSNPSHADSQSSLKLAGYNEGNTERQGACRFWYFKISNGNTILMDLIPVRFTNEQNQSEGAMYDRVSGALFRNAGTGSFTIGPDVAAPVMGLHFMKLPKKTAKNYVQDGLIAMWDGIENAGFGKHSADASSFVDLVSGGSVLVGPYGSSVNEVPAWTVESTGIRSNELNYSKMVGIAIPYTFASPGSNWTVEYARSIHIRDNHQENFPVFNFNPYASSASQSLSVYPYHVNQNNVSSIRLRYSGQWSIKDKNGFTEGERDGLNVIGFTSSTIGGNSKCAYVNGGFVQKSTTIGSMYKDSNTTHLCISSSGFDVTIHSFRVYNRALTAEEIAHNYAVDKERFNLP